MFVLSLSFPLTQEPVLELDFIVNAHVLYPDTKGYEKGLLAEHNHCKYFPLLYGFMVNFNQVENVLNWSNLEFGSNPRK